MNKRLNKSIIFLAIGFFLTAAMFCCCREVLALSKPSICHKTVHSSGTGCSPRQAQDKNQCSCPEKLSTVVNQNPDHLKGNLQDLSALDHLVPLKTKDPLLAFLFSFERPQNSSYFSQLPLYLKNSILRL